METKIKYVFIFFKEIIEIFLEDKEKQLDVFAKQYYL